MQEEKKQYYGLFVHYNEGKDFILDMVAKYPNFNMDICKYILPIEYPIVFIEVDVLEKSFEDFPIVEKTVLGLVDNGITRSSQIAELLGLTESYIAKILKILAGYGHIDKNGVTKLGKESLRREQSVKLNQVKQRMQIDGVTAEPIRVANFISDQTLKDPGRTAFFEAHLSYLEGVSKSYIMSKLQNEYSSYVGKDKSVLHTNAERINDATFLKIQFSKAYYIQDHYGNIAVFGNIYNKEKVNLDERFEWKPLFVSNRSIIETFGLEPDAPLLSEKSKAIVSALRQSIEEKRGSVDEERWNIIDQLLPIDSSHVKFVGSDKGILEIESKSFIAFDKIILKLLESIAKDGYDIIIVDELYGEFIKVTTKDAHFMNVAVRYKEVVEKIGRKKAISIIEKKIGNKHNVIEAIGKIVDDIEIDEK